MAIEYKNEELLNAISHGVGVVLGIVGLVLLITNNSYKTDYSTLSILFYGFSIVILFLASTIYHSVTSTKWKTIFRKIDHISIYLLIAGTYTPVALITLEDSSGWIIFWIVWGTAGVGTILKIFFTGKFEILSLLLYLLMGWLIVFDYNNLIESTSILGLRLLMLGGLFYTLGIIFYAVRRIPYNHFIWHLFVLGGSIAHFLFIFLTVI